MKIKLPPLLPGFLLVSTTLILSGCATPQKNSFNDDYDQHLLTAPKYYIEEHGDSRFTVTVEQGLPSSGPERVLDLKQAATAVAATEARHLSWADWKLDYISERNDGWMHVVKAEVRPKNPVVYNGDR